MNCMLDKWVIAEGEIKNHKNVDYIYFYIIFNLTFGRISFDLNV